MQIGVEDYGTYYSNPYYESAPRTDYYKYNPDSLYTVDYNALKNINAHTVTTGNNIWTGSRTHEQPSGTLYSRIIVIKSNGTVSYNAIAECFNWYWSRDVSSSGGVRPIVRIKSNANIYKDGDTWKFID